MADFRDKLKSALLYTSDYAAGQTGEKQNLYGTYQEQKTKREEAEAKRLQMEREAALAQQKLQMDLYKQQLSLWGKRQEAQVREIGGLPERGLRPVTSADVQHAPIGPGITPQQASQRLLAREANKALYQGSQRAIVPSADGTFQRFTQIKAEEQPDNKKYLIQGEARRAFEKSGGVFPATPEAIAKKSEETGLDINGILKRLNLKPVNGNYEVPAGWVSATSELARNEAKISSRPLSGADAKTMSQAEAVISAIDELVPMVGTEAELYGYAPFGGFKEGGQEFQKLTKNIKSTLVYLRSGAAINEAEYKRLSSLLPELFTKAGVDKKQLARFKNEFSGILGRMREGIKWDEKRKEFTGGSSESAGVNVDELF